MDLIMEFLQLAGYVAIAYGIVKWLAAPAVPSETNQIYPKVSGSAVLSDLKGWKESSGHNAVIINQGIWDDNNWKAIGVGISKGYSVVWFGEELDNN